MEQRSNPKCFIKVLHFKDIVTSSDLAFASEGKVVSTVISKVSSRPCSIIVVEYGLYRGVTIADNSLYDAVNL